MWKIMSIAPAQRTTFGFFRIVLFITTYPFQFFDMHERSRRILKKLTVQALLWFTCDLTFGIVVGSKIDLCCHWKRDCEQPVLFYWIARYSIFMTFFISRLPALMERLKNEHHYKHISYQTVKFWTASFSNALNSELQGMNHQIRVKTLDFLNELSRQSINVSGGMNCSGTMYRTSTSMVDEITQRNSQGLVTEIDSPHQSMEMAERKTVLEKGNKTRQMGIIFNHYCGGVNNILEAIELSIERFYDYIMIITHQYRDEIQSEVTQIKSKRRKALFCVWFAIIHMGFFILPRVLILLGAKSCGMFKFLDFVNFFELFVFYLLLWVFFDCSSKHRAHQS